MRNPLNAGAQVNVTSPLFDENKNYLYSNLELTPNVFAHIAMSLCRGTQRSRGDVITGVVVYHQTHGGITAGNEYISTFKKATKILRNKGLLKNLGYGQWLFKSEANETSLELDSYVTKEEDSQIPIDETLGTGNETVYVYYYDAYRQLAETRGQKHWPCKVGMTSQQTISRIFSQTGLPTQKARTSPLSLSAMTQRDWRMSFTLYYLSEKEKLNRRPVTSGTTQHWKS